MNKAVFLDRDGVVNKDRPDYTYIPGDFILLDHLMEALHAFARKGYLLIVVSNQGGIARGIYSHEAVDALNEILFREARRHGIRIMEMYYCPHYTELGRCICRKPDSLLIEKALARFDIDPKASFFIGDQDRDMEAAAKAGVTGIRVETNCDLRVILPLVP